MIITEIYDCWNDIHCVSDKIKKITLKAQLISTQHLRELIKTASNWIHPDDNYFRLRVSIDSTFFIIIKRLYVNILCDFVLSSAHLIPVGVNLY